MDKPLTTPIAVSAPEAARLIGVCPWTVRRQMRLGRLQTVRIGRRKLVPMADLERFVRDATQVQS
jgi:excisionase family DNA binding protein